MSEPERDTLADALKSLEGGVSRRLIANAEHFWQKRYYDFNIRNAPQFEAKLRYIHLNPVKRGLCESPDVGTRASRREAVSCRRTAPLKPTAGWSGAPVIFQEVVHSIRTREADCDEQ